jgi:hypothetical protein
MLSTIASAWQWKGVQPISLIAQNAFGNVIFTDGAGQYWRICPEELSCTVIAADKAAFQQLWLGDEFVLDWQMDIPVATAEKALGAPGDDRCYCLKIPAVLGGQYGVENFRSISRKELISFAGEMARQIDHLPNGANVRLRFVD